MDEERQREALGLIELIDASPSPYHACATVAERLVASGFRELEEIDAWTLEEGTGWYVLRGGSLLAGWVPPGWTPEVGFRVLGAHTDSPNLRVKPRPDMSAAGFRQLGVEVYGGVLLNSWLDRDLGLSGRVMVRGSDGAEARRFRIDRPVLRVPQLAIHLDREVVNTGLVLNKQRHLPPVWTTDAGDERGFRELLAAELAVDAKDVLAWDAMVHDVQPSRLVGWDADMVSAPRLDNLCSCYVGLRALEDALAASEPPTAMPILSFFDHEEVGSASRAGADGPVLADLLERAVLAAGGDREAYLRAVAASFCVSADMAHATHPNYPEKHDATHTLVMNGGPVIKINAVQRYATEGETEALFQLCCETAGVPCQKWVMRSDLACGSTIGPMTAAKLGMPTVDVGLAQLAMHSARELCGAEDPAMMVGALNAFLYR